MMSSELLILYRQYAHDYYDFRFKFAVLLYSGDKDKSKLKHSPDWYLYRRMCRDLSSCMKNLMIRINNYPLIKEINDGFRVSCLSRLDKLNVPLTFYYEV